MPHKLTVMISSTARDMPLHRKEVMDACLRQGMFPVMMEHLPASDAEAIAASLRMVDEADMYLGVFAHRYGYVPKENNPQQLSVTEMEYNRAVERKIPRMIFVMDKTHSITIDDVEQGAGAVRLKAFKERVETDNIVNFFKSPADLRADVINSLSQHRQPDLATFHYVSDIPAPPEPFIAHPYTLLQTHRLVGRQSELNRLADWVTRREEQIYQARILNIVAIGGLGKSALTWKWFNDIAPQEMKPLAGRMWWSFYESDATFENFITRALAYVMRAKLEEVQQIAAHDRAPKLLAALDREPFLIVLDGLERILITYARMDAAHLADDELDRQTPQLAAHADGLPASTAPSLTGEHRPRKTADRRAGVFLRELSSVRASRILVSTRLYPADLLTETGKPLPGCQAISLRGLNDTDALGLWRDIGVTGPRDVLLSLFNSVGNHPLLVQALASEVARFRRAPGDFDVWRRHHPDFDPFNLPRVQAKLHVLEFALRGLDYKAGQALHVIAGFRMTARYDTLAALLIGEGKVCADEHELDTVLTELEDRGLVGWDKRANRYDLHPIVRRVVWSGLDTTTRRSIYGALKSYLETSPTVDAKDVASVEDLATTIELYNTLVGLERYSDAIVLFRDRLNNATLYRLNKSLLYVELLEMLFPNGIDRLPNLSQPAAQCFALTSLAQGYQFRGQIAKAMGLYNRVRAIAQEEDYKSDLSLGLRNLVYVLSISGKLVEAQAVALESLRLTRPLGEKVNEAAILYMLGTVQATRKAEAAGRAAIDRSLRIVRAEHNERWEGVIEAFRAERALWSGDNDFAFFYADRAWDLATVRCYEMDFICAARLQGAARLHLGDFKAADERLQHALRRARAVNLVEEDLHVLVLLAELRRRQSNPEAAREFLDDVWDAAERGPYPLIHADACNVLAQIERDAGNTSAAVQAATRAFRLSWCDGPPFAYHWGLEKARKHLRELGVAEPQMPPFDEAKYEPMPEVEIDPEDEFHAGKSGDV